MPQILKRGIMSYKFKLIFSYLIIFTIVMLLIFNLFDTFTKSNVGNISTKNFKSKFQERQNFIEGYFASYKSGVLSIQSDKNFQSFLSNKTDTKIIQNAFLTIKKSLPCLYGVKYIDLNGNEIIRIDGTPINKFGENAKSYIVEEKNLENKSDTYYFKEFNKLKKGEVGFSNMDLSFESKNNDSLGRVTLRMAVLAIDENNQKRGIVVFNICLSNFFQQLEDTTLYHIHLIDKNGNFIYHHNSKNYGLSGSNKNYSLFDEMPFIAKEILKNDEFLNDNFYSNKIGTINNQQNIKLILERKFHEESENSRITQDNFIVISLCIAFIMLFISIYFSKLPDLLKDKLKDKKELENKNRFIESLLKSIPIPMFYKDVNGVYFDINESFTDIFGITRDMIIGKTVHDIAPKELADEYKNYDDDLIKSKSKDKQVYESLVNNPHNGKISEVIFFKNLFFDHNDNVKGIIGAVIDVTELKNTQRELKKLNTNLEEQVKVEVDKNIQQELKLFESNKLASMGSMISNIIHQWKQPLSIISINATSLRVDIELENNPSYEEIDKKMVTIIDSIKRLSETTDTFRNFLKNKKEIKRVSLNAILEKALVILGNMQNYDLVTIEKSFDEDENLIILTIENELMEVVINIMNNAFYEIEARKIEKGLIKLKTIKKENSVELTIEDNAGGIPNEVISKVFDEYFTTKPDECGTGLGLHMTKRIVENSLNGKIIVFNSEAGAVFQIDLPFSSTTEK